VASIPSVVLLLSYRQSNGKVRRTSRYFCSLPSNMAATALTPPFSPVHTEIIDMAMNGVGCRAMHAWALA
jgi:transposase-like protein